MKGKRAGGGMDFQRGRGAAAETMVRMSTVIIATNLGHLKAFRVAETPMGTRRLELIKEVEFPEAHGRIQDRVTDMAGRFPVGDGMGTTMANGEALKAELEVERRLTKLVGEQIEDVLNSERPEYWHFAATSEIHQALLNELPTELRQRVIRHVQADLTRMPAPEVLTHFMPVKAA